MQRFSIARSLRVALIGLTVVLAVVSTVGVSGLYATRQRYEDVLARSSALATAAANLAAAGLAEAEVLRDARGAGATNARLEVARSFAQAAASARSLAAGDPASARLVSEQTATQAQVRRLVAGKVGAGATAASGALARARALAAGLQTRQRARQTDARRRASSDSRRAIVLVVLAGVLAFAGALALITLLVSGMRRPLDALVDATRGLAAGELSRRVQPAGPRELRDLGGAFNAMAEDLNDANRRIEKERRRLSVAIESLGDALIITEPDSSTIAAVNPRASDLIPELVASGHVDAAGSPFPALKDALGSERTVEHRGRMLAITAAPLGSQADGIVWTVRDVSERARLERAKSDFVATASHELRSPLTSIKGFVELLDRSPENMSPRQREFVEIILRSTDRLVDLVNDLLDVAQIEADRVEISRHRIDVGEAVREVVELMGPRIGEKHQHLSVNIAGVLPLALADPDRIRQIIANLLTNAHLYTPAGGRIDIGVQADRARIEIVVADSGVGMTRETSERVFERFYRGIDMEATSRGTGLGLSIVKSLVDLHGGQIDVESKPGEGTTFRVRLPCAAPRTDTAHSLEVRG